MYLVALDPDQLPQQPFWDQVASDLVSRGALAGALAAIYSLIVIAWWIGYVHRTRRLASHMPIRILVTGTRGKSSVVRLLHGALRAAGYRVAGKTTGTAARILEPDGNERPTVRLGQVSILETLSSISSAERQGANALVTECMAVKPDLIRHLSLDIVRPTIVDVTNAELDHLEEEGTDRRSIMVSLAEAINPGQLVVTSERDPLAVWDLQQKCLQSGSPLMVAERATGLCRNGAPLIAHGFPDNIALALATTRACGIPDETALAGMRNATREPQNEEVFDVQLGEFSVRYCNLGSINDADNALPAVERSLGPRGEGRLRIAVLAGRADRPLRAVMFAGLLPPAMFDAVVISGGPELRVRSALLNSGWAATRLLRLGVAAYSVKSSLRRVHDLVRLLDSRASGYDLVILENIHVPFANRLHRFFSERALGGQSS